MKIEKFNLWKDIPFECNKIPEITAYIPDEKTSPWGIVIFPGGAYSGLAPHEGDAYARFLAENGVCAFSVDYRVAPHHFPCQLVDARRAVKWVRYNAEKYGVDKEKIAVMGSSAGGHLAALVSTYKGEIEFSPKDEVENECYVPNGQILCYPVISVEPPFGHIGSGINLLGEDNLSKIPEVTPLNLVDENTPKAFIWHTFADNGVSVLNSYKYAEALKNNGVKTEMHIFPDGRHGIGLCAGDINKDEGPDILNHNKVWAKLLLDWLKYTEN